MFDIDYKTDDGTEYTLQISVIYYDYVDDGGVDMDIAKINPSPSRPHENEIDQEWSYRGKIYEKATDLAFTERSGM